MLVKPNFLCRRWCRQVGDLGFGALWAIVAAACVVAISVVPALAQDSEIPCEPDGGVVFLDNSYIAVCMGAHFFGMDERKTHDFHEGCPPDNCKDKRQVMARYGMWAVGGDPESADDDNVDLIRQSQFWGPSYRNGYTTVWVDGAVSVVGETEGNFDPNLAEGPYYAQLKDAPPDNPNKYFIRYVWITSTGNVHVDQRLTLVRDQARFDYIITNNDTTSHNVGLRMFTDVIVNDNGTVTGCLGDYEAYPYILGFGFVAPVETAWSGQAVPSVLEVYNSRTDPTCGVRFTLKEQDATPPDWLAIGSWHLMHGDTWDYTVDPFLSIGDHAVAVRWDPTLLAPGQTRRIVTYYGMAAASSDYAYPYVLAVQAPKALKFRSDLPDRLYPNPFTVTAYVDNLYSNVTMRDLTLFINLPQGLELAPGESASKSISEIGPLSEGPSVSWQVKPTGTVGGEVELTVSASGASIPAKTVKRKIAIPLATRASLDPGWQMVSAPFNFLDPDPRVALGLPAADFQTFRWNPRVGSYADVTAITPGAGFWLWSRLLRTTTFANAVPVDSTSTYEMDLLAGWNQIGNPFLYNVALGKIKILYQTEMLSVEEAANRGWVRRTLYWYDAGRREYDYSAGSLLGLEPWRGYWLKALVPCRFIFPPVETVGAGVSSVRGLVGGVIATASADVSVSSASPASLPDGWRIRLAASAGGESDSKNFVGAALGASDGYDPLDAEEPPPCTDKIILRIVNPACGPDSALLATDIRGGAGRQVYDVEVSTSLSRAPVQIRWSGLESVPNGHTVTFVDPVTRAKRDMRRSSGYSFRSASAGTRKFQVVVSPPEVRIYDLKACWQCRAGRADISFGLSADAVVTVRILDNYGRIVRNLVNNVQVRKGVTSYGWDGRDESGVGVPGGRYTIEVSASASPGIETRKTCSVYVRRK